VNCTQKISSKQASIEDLCTSLTWFNKWMKTNYNSRNLERYFTQYCACMLNLKVKGLKQATLDKLRTPISACMHAVQVKFTNIIEAFSCTATCRNLSRLRTVYVDYQ